MATRIPLQVTGLAYTHPSQPTNNQQCVNMYPSIPQSNLPPEDANESLEKGRGTATLMRTMGFQSIGSVGANPASQCRGFYQIKLDLNRYLTVIVVGAEVYSVNFNSLNKTISPVLLGTLQTTNGVVSISSNSTQIFFTCYDFYSDISKASIYNYQTNTFTHVTDPDFLGASNVIMIDSYFICNRVGTAQFYTSEPNDGLSWNALNVATAESNPDKLLAMGQSKGELWLFGSNSTEVWYDAANSPGMPFSKRAGSDIDIGCAAPASVVSVSGSLVWLDSRRFVVMSDYSPFFRNNSSGYNLTKLSNEAIDAELASYSKVSNALATTYVDNGHVMYEITFPDARKTWVYDLTVNGWHQKVYTVDNVENSSLINYYVQNESYLLGASYYNNKIYIIGREYLTDDGQPIFRKRTTTFFNDKHTLITMHSVELKCNTGKMTGNNEAFISMRYSTDSGYTWSNTMIRSLGKTGEYNKRVIWNRLGTAYEWLFEFTVSDAVDFSIVDATAYVDLEVN